MTNATPPHGANSEMCLALYRKSLKSKEMDHGGTHFDGQHPHVFVTLGASVSRRVKVNASE
jgi:hypothetical protein